MLDDNSSKPATTSDLIAVLRLTPMPAATRTATIKSVRKFRETLMSENDPKVDDLFAVLAAISGPQRELLGIRHTQIVSDMRRAARAWSEPTQRSLAIGLRGRLPTLSDALDAVRCLQNEDKAKRTEHALRQLAASQSTALDDIVATSAALEPILRRLRPEDLGVSSIKSLTNKLSLIRASIKLVDVNALNGREADVKSLPDEWRILLSALGKHTPEHAKAEMAIFRRLALRADRAGLCPSGLRPEFIKKFVSEDLATKSDAHREKMRRASRIWDQVADELAIDLVGFQLPQRSDRLPDVKWSAVPNVIRARVDAMFETMVSAHADVPWASFLENDDDGLGLSELSSDSSDERPKLTREPGTRRNLQDAVKRVWHAAAQDPSVSRKPQVLEDLFQNDCLVATVAAIRAARRQKIEGQGQDWEAHKKGRYECSIVQALLSVGTLCGCPDDILGEARRLIWKLDPSIVGSKIQADGSIKRIYEDRRIGKHHETMLRQFQHDSALLRWFQAPQTLWQEAERCPKQKKKEPTLAQAALARSALIAQLAQRVSPMRRTNFARLRVFGDHPHISLPVDAGEGRLILPAVEMKNARAVHVTIDPETVRMIKRFIEVYRPIFAKTKSVDEANEHLFPGAGSARKEKGENVGYPAGLGYVSKDKMSARFGQHVKKHCQLDMDMHVMRHIAAKVILDMDPGAMGLVQELLAHKRIETTRSYYAQVCKIVAQRNYLKLLDKYTRRVMSNVSFRIVDEQEAEE